MIIFSQAPIWSAPEREDEWTGWSLIVLIELFILWLWTPTQDFVMIAVCEKIGERKKKKGKL